MIMTTIPLFCGNQSESKQMCHKCFSSLLRCLALVGAYILNAKIIVPSQAQIASEYTMWDEHTYIQCCSIIYDIHIPLNIVSLSLSLCFPTFCLFCGLNIVKLKYCIYFAANKVCVVFEVLGLWSRIFYTHHCEEPHDLLFFICYVV